jgi:hypothetical protein
LGFERLERGHLIAEVVEAQLVEIPLPPGDRQILSPPVGDARIGDRSAGIDLLHAVGPRSQRNLKGGLAEIARLAVRVLPLPVVLRQDGKLPDDHRADASIRLQHTATAIPRPTG